MSDATTLPRHCLNCGMELQGHFCHRCGQKDQNRRLPLKALLHDVFHDLWHLDHKILESLRLLCFRPGFLTAEYLSGRRIRHVPPFRLYVILSFALFMAFASLKIGGAMHEQPRPDAKVMAQAIDQHAKAPEEAKVAKAAVEEALTFEKKLEQRALYAKSHPEAFQRAFFSSLSKALFVLMPLFAGILHLLHLRKESLFIDHMVLSLHHHAFSFVVILLLLGLQALPGKHWGTWPGFFLFMAPPVHLTVAIQRLYGRGWVRSTLKVTIASVLYGMVVAFTLLGLLLLSVWLAH